MNDNNHRAGHGPGPLPERWLRCPRRAFALLDDKFLAFKTPLDEKFDEQIPIQYRFTPAMVFQGAKNVITSTAKNVERRRLALWIDLTRTKRFYDTKEVEDQECKYVKIECHGHEGAPNAEQTAKFLHVCRTFLSKDPINIIGIHCTHGFNRTGFLLVSLLVEVYDWNLAAAIRGFAAVRPPGIYKDEYIRELYRRYDDANESLKAPHLPDWCYEENSNHSEATPDTRQGGNFKKRPARFKDNPTFMEGVSGVDPITDREQVSKIREKIRNLAGSAFDSFIGSQPVSMDPDNLGLLARKPYRVSWKADGTRYMMFVVAEDEVYFIDRDNSAFKVRELKFFLRKCNSQHLTNTLLDGEMVIDKVDNKLYPRYLVYDILFFEGNNVGEQTFNPIRMAIIEKEIIGPRTEAMKEGRIVKEREPFGIRAKPFYDIASAGQLLSEKFARQLSHPPDGLIFQPSDDPYKYGTADHVLKWKPLSMNSIDFKLKVNRVQKEGCLPEYIGDLLAGGNNRYGQIKCSKALRELNNRIIECKYENNRWVFMRERPDKSFPNSDKTAEAVLKSIRTPVTEAMLLEFIRLHGWKNPMPPPMAPPPVKRQRTSSS